MKKVSKTGLNLIKKWESLELNSYLCPAGKETIGYGHVILKDDHFSQPITEGLATDLLIADCKIAEDCINKYVTVPLTSNQFDALVSLIFNVGKSAFKSSNGLVELNYNRTNSAAEEFFSETKGFVHVNGKVSKGLVNRRKDENALWSL
jgi:lysozyme